MAKLAAKMILNLPWMKASELNLCREESKQQSLELAHLKNFFPSGLQRGCLVEINGPRSSGRTSLSLYILAASIANGETCAFVDLDYQFHPAQLAQTGVLLDQLSWVKCNGNTEHALRSADLLLHAGGFGIVLLDLCGADAQTLNRIPISYWYRFQRAIQNTSTILLVCSERQQTRSCSRYSLSLKARKFHWKGDHPFTLLNALELTALPNKPAQSKVTSIRQESIFIPSGVA